MIASLKGRIHDVFPDFLILEVNGVGYKIEGASGYYEAGMEAQFYIFTHYSQQDTRLFGFPTREAFLFFADLLTVPGVGPKTAAGLINNVGLDEMKEYIVSNDPKSLTGNGVGLKTAQKIILELSQKIIKSGYKSTHKDGSAHRIPTEINEEVEDALMGLGYNKNEVQRLLNEIPFESGQTVESVLRIALKKLSGKK